MITSYQVNEIQKIIKYKFKNINYLKNSLTHSSIYKDKKISKKKIVNEFNRLEFLGDRVLGLVVASLIFNKFKEYDEGNLSKKFSFLVQREFLYKIALELNLGEFLNFIKQKKFNARLNKSILADSIESIIGAIFLDGGYFQSYKFIKRVWSPYLNDLDSNEIDPKTRLQEISQKKYKKLPEYSLIKKEGPPHSPKFTISLKVLNFQEIKTQDSSIRDAEKKAAKKILKLLNEK